MHGESVVPGVQVARPVGAKLFGSVSISSNLSPQRCLAYLGSPTLAEANKEPLIAAEAILHDVRCCFEREPISIVSRQKAGHVRDVFAKRLMPVHSQIRKRPVGVELRRECLARGLEVFEIFLCPPVGEPSLRIKLAALVVKTMADLMTDGRPN